MKIDLNGSWKLSWQKKKSGSIPENINPVNTVSVNVPGDIHLALLDAGIIKDPTLSDNVKELRWISDQEWWFVRDFDFNGDHKGEVELSFNGLDYQADVWLNGCHIGCHKNMFRPFKREVSGKLKQKNHLAVRLLPFLEDVSQLPDPDMLHNAKREHHTMDTAVNRARPWMRKAQYVFGWNWTQDLSTCGIWQDVFLYLQEEVTLSDGAVFTKTADNERAELTFTCSAENHLNEAMCAALNVTLCSPEGERETCFEKEIILVPGRNILNETIDVGKPKLWWPAGYGEQNLYKAEYSISFTGKTAAESSVRFGIRTVEIKEPLRTDTEGWSFKFLINGRYIFIKGANWVPADACPARVTAEKRRALLEKAVAVNFNYLRVWGGGIYEPDDFYDVCDELGIMVWQDFMYSCAEYPDFDKEFYREAELEADYQIRRLRSHPSVICWCGNNEIEQQCGSSAFRTTRPEGRYYGEKIFKELIPELLSNLDPDRPYRHSSGISGIHDPDETAMKYESGIIHIDVFDEIFRKGKKQIPSFLGEWYSAGPPVMKSIEQFIPEQER
ncbi:MAG: glycoside hydrolase family 2 protein, partial [Planctomycetota bacterium]